MKVVVNIKLKDLVLDPAGKATQDALCSLDFNVKNVRIGKQIVFDLDKKNEDEARKEVTKMCEELLANTVIEDYEIVL
ncbi:phosphoribosylformylglycinamidine synthase, purS protein [Campylobacter ureolyticus ACS-301-V-Sch3b]|uniref:Phosphoribosylformylglycinamidine synthase subunit PurS n=1 Tax=Campylobacter ureolyticus ACS-301-V-Sch3b TaxID=883165 RepID=S3XF75_9BACT|nr:phosphoribosylformylglycinamidine synthase subunit PurS [Campylobacter ureolyticus]EPH08007.1 phosphoribosylformylglycinamidine synthase, purS protein [Campylobacter ureolyticus ACS-301-V-Sch3b]